MGEKVNKQGLTLEEFLAQYDASKFQRPSVTVDMLLFTLANLQTKDVRKLPEKELQLLLIKRGDHPCIGQWAIPGGFVNIDESLEKAALRELKEETSVDNVYMEQLYTFGEPERDPRTRVISSAYMALVDGSQLQVKAADDADDAKWFTIKSRLSKLEKFNTVKGFVLSQQLELNLKSEEIKLSATLEVKKEIEGKTTKAVKWTIVECNGIAFDHAKVIAYGLNRLRNKTEYTDIAFNLMPELFSLTELQQVYEVILGREFTSANFRRKISRMVEETQEVKRNAGHRPAKLFRFNPLWSGEIC